MGKRDFGGHEAKKPKKDARKNLASTIQPIRPIVEVEVIGKKKRKGRE